MSEETILMAATRKEREKKAREVREYAIGGWFDLAKLRFNFEALAKGEAPIYDGPGWVMEFSRSGVKWVRYENRGLVPMYAEEILYGASLFPRSMMRLPCEPYQIARVISPKGDRCGGLVVIEARRKS